MDLEVFPRVITQLGFINGELGDFFRYVLPRHRPDHGRDQLVDLFLGIIGNLLLGRARARHHGFDLVPR